MITTVNKQKKPHMTKTRNDFQKTLIKDIIFSRQSNCRNLAILHKHTTWYVAFSRDGVMKRGYKKSMVLPGGAQSVYKVDRPAWYLQGDIFNFIVGLTAFVSFIVV